MRNEAIDADPAPRSCKLLAVVTFGDHVSSTAKRVKLAECLAFLREATC